MIINKRLLIVLFTVLFSIPGMAQDNEKHSLRKVLLLLEQRYNVRFAYIDENIEGAFSLLPSKKLNLKETLHYLRKNTGLIFQQLDDRYVSISKAKAGSRDICGFITQSDTKEAVAGASIQSGNVFAISNGDGYFQLKDVSDSVVHIRFIGFRAMDLMINEFLGKPCKKIPLLPEFTTLQEIFVSDFITEGIDKQMDGSFVIRAETLGMLPGLIEPDVLQTIQTLPGIQSINETISDINVRGGTNDQNLVLWDGIKMYHSGHFFGLISAYNPFLTKKVTLVKNGSGSAFGDGVSSTIDIRTDDQMAENFSMGAGINMINGDVFASVPLSHKASIQVSSRRSAAGIFQTPAYKQYFERAFRDTDVTNFPNADTLLNSREKFYFYDASFKLLYNISDKDKLRFSFLNVFNSIEYQENAIINNLIETRTSELEQRNLGSGFSYSRLWNEKIRTSAQLYLSRYALGAVNFDVLNDQRLIQENKVLDTGLKLDTRFSLTDNIDLFCGYQFFEVGVSNLEDINDPPFRRSIKKVVRSHAAFLEANLTLDQTNIRFGVRNNYFPGFQKLVIEPRLTFTQNFLEYFSLEILGEMKNQSMTQIIDLQSDFLGVEKRRWVLSNDADIPLIRSKQASAGAYYKTNNFLISVEAYYKFVKGIITSSQGFQNQFQFVRSSGNYQTVGIDFLISEKFDPFRIWFSYSNAESTFEFQQLIPPSFPNNLDIRHRTTFGCSYQANKLELSAGLNWHSGKPFTEPMKTNEIINDKINYNVPNTSRLDDYLRIDFSVKYQFPIGHKTQGQVAASIWNILNRKNVVNRYFQIGENGQLESLQQVSLALTPNMTFRIKF